MRPKYPSPFIALSAGLLLVAGCSRSEDTPNSATETADASAESAAAPPAVADRTAEPVAAPADSARFDAGDTPGITTTAAPGVAFAYRYAFTLPAKAISSVQQQHAAACERLGPARCQVTGLSYEQPRESEVQARLDLLLAPDLAQRFGGESIAAVDHAEGRLENASVAGDDAGGAIEESQRSSALLKAALARIEKRLISKGLAADERSQLARQAEELRGQLGGEQLLRADKEAALATTPMSFAYGSEGLFAAGNDPFGKAAATSLGSAGAMLAMLLTLAGLALPWLLLAALVTLLFRFRAMKARLAQLSALAPAADPVAP